MIGKPAKSRKDGRSNFRTLINYIVGDRGEKKETNRAVYVGTRNIFSDTSKDYKTAALEMSGLGHANTRIKDPVFHFMLSFRPEEIPTTVQVDEAVDIALKALGLEKCKALYGLQNDNGIHHIHVCTCKVDPETGNAIDPGKKWKGSKRALIRASREIELTQGWEILKEDLSWQVQNGQIVKRDHKKNPISPTLRTEAQDLEAHMGEKSAQRIAIEQASGLIRESRSWEELHEKLHSAGFEYRKKGSGAVIVVNGVFVKASDVGRDCSLSYIEKRIAGKYQEPNDRAIPRSAALSAEAEGSLRTDGEHSDQGIKNNHKLTKPEPTQQTAVTKKTLSSWQRYQVYREQYLLKKSERNEFFARQKAERLDMKKLHKLERDEIFKISWKGKGNLLNQQRMITASRQLRDRILLKQQHQLEQTELSAFEKFLSYRKWLANYEPERIDEIRNWKVKKQQSQKNNKGANKVKANPGNILDDPYLIESENMSDDNSTYDFHKKENVQASPQALKPEDKETTPSQPEMPKPSVKMSPPDENELEKEKSAQPIIQHGNPVFSPFTQQSADSKYRPLDSNITTKEGEKEVAIAGMEKYQTMLNDDKDRSISYSLYGEPVAFIEKKESVEVLRVSESSLLAAMQVAQNKWGGVKVDGNKEHLDVCARLAEEFKIKTFFPKEYLEERNNKDKINQQSEQPQTGEVPLEFKSEQKNDSRLKAYDRAKEAAAKKLKSSSGKVYNAIPEKSYKGTVIGIESDYLMLKTGKDIALVSTNSLTTVPEVGKEVKLDALRKYATRRDITIQDRSLGR